MDENISPREKKKVAAVDRKAAQPALKTRSEMIATNEHNLILVCDANYSQLSCFETAQLYLDETPVLVIRCCSRKKKNGQNKLIAH